MKQNNPQPVIVRPPADEVDDRYRAQGNRPPGKSVKQQRLHGVRRNIAHRPLWDGMLKSVVVSLPIRLIAVDIDGTLLNPQFQISPTDLAALQRAKAQGVEVILVTGRRHTFAMPIARQLGFDLQLISSNGAVTRSMQGETFHRDLLPAPVCRKLCTAMTEFRGNTVITFDQENKGAIVLEHMNELNASIQKWLEKNSEFIEFVIPIEDSLTKDPVQAMFCGPIERMHRALETLSASGLRNETTVLRTEYLARDLSLIDVLNKDCSKGHALERWAKFRGISREQVMAIGDNHNDVEMLAFAGVAFIMGNAVEELRSNGWRVTLPNDQNGVAAAVEQALNF
jgi:Cof subfamily protein (haloacid dehalogenase superfamily)